MGRRSTGFAVNLIIHYMCERGDIVYAVYNKTVELRVYVDQPTFQGIVHLELQIYPYIHKGILRGLGETDS